MKIFLINNFNLSFNDFDDLYFVNKYSLSDIFEFPQFIYKSEFLNYKTLTLNSDWDFYCMDISLIPKKYHEYFYLWNIKEDNINYKISYFFYNLSWIFLHTLSLVSKHIILNKNFFQFEKILDVKNIFSDNLNWKILISKSFILPDNLVVTDNLYKLYNVLEKKLNNLSGNNYINNIFFEDFILSLLPFKYWWNSLFFLNSNLKFKIINFFNKYEDIISLHVPVARSKYIEELFLSLLTQTSTNFKLIIWVDWYNETHKKEIVKIINKYKNSFKDFSYFVNKKNLWVWKTRWKLLNKDKTSKYVVFLDDDNFLSSNTIEWLYQKTSEYSKCWMYSIANLDVRFDVKYQDYINNFWPFNQPLVYTNRERVSRLPLFCDQEETPLIHNRFYSDLLDIKYHETFDSCSVDMVYNRFLEIICWNINLEWMIQFMRVWHIFHQTRSEGFNEKEFKYVMYILQTICFINNNVPYFTYLIKTNVPKQNELFLND